MESWILKGQICYSTGRRSRVCVQDGFLVCICGVCQGVFHTLPETYAGLPLFDYENQLIIPGLVDLHLHGPQYAYRGLGMDLELLDWLNTRTFPEEAKFQDLTYAQRAYEQFALELKRSFTTRAVVFATAHTQATLLLMDLLEKTGVVTWVGRVNMDRNCPEDLREPDATASLSETRRWLEAVDGRYSKTRPILTPRFAPACSDALLEGLGKLSAELGLPVQSHLSENLGEVDLVQQLFPWSSCYAQVYERYGLLGGNQPCIMAHCVHSMEAELELFRNNGVYIAHSPESNMNISSGVAPVSQYLDLGLSVGLATDVAGGSSLSMLRAMAYAIQASKLRWRLLDQAVSPLTFDEAFYLATLGGGAFFGQVGSFAPGFAFDALVLDDRMLPTVLDLSIADRVERLAYLGDNRCLTAKFVSGQRVL